MIKPLRTASFLLCTAVAVPVMAQDFDKGRAAYRAGDYTTALQEWRPLAEQSNAEARFMLGFMYEWGQGVPQDYSEAFKWYRLAAEHGNAVAQMMLGAMYTTGIGVHQDKVRGYMWFNLSAINGMTSVVENRDKIAKEMTSADVSQAQAMAHVCMGSSYTDCGW